MNERKARKAAYLQAMRVYLESPPGRSEVVAREKVERAWRAWQEVAADAA